MEGDRKKVGRPSTAGKEGEKSTLSIRASASLKDNLDAAAKTNGRSLSQEAEIRLEQSFRDEDRLEMFRDTMYGSELSAILELIATTMSNTIKMWNSISFLSTKKDTSWIDQAFVFDQVAISVQYLFESFRPEGDVNDHGMPINHEVFNFARSGTSHLVFLANYAGDDEKVRSFIELLKRKLGADVWKRFQRHLEIHGSGK